MSNINLLAIDIAKINFQLHGVDLTGNIVLRKKLTRNKLIKYISNLPSCTIAMEACGGANFWARKFTQFGHAVKLISPQIEEYDKLIAAVFKQNIDCQKIAQIEGVGLLTATALIACIGDIKLFKNGRHLSAYLGLVPKQHSNRKNENFVVGSSS